MTAYFNIPVFRQLMTSHSEESLDLAETWLQHCLKLGMHPACVWRAKRVQNNNLSSVRECPAVAYDTPIPFVIWPNIGVIPSTPSDNGYGEPHQTADHLAE
jgi:hypothetical protein